MFLSHKKIGFSAQNMSFSERKGCQMEHLDFSVARKRQNVVPVAMDAVYYVFADEEYWIRHRPLKDSLILVSTLNGQGTIQVNGHELKLSPGDMAVFDPSRETFHYFCTVANWNFWWFEFRCLSPDFLELPLEKAIHLPLDQTQLSLCERALSYLKLGDIKTSSFLLASLLCMLQKQSLLTEEIHGNTDAFRKADRYIRQHLDSVTVETTAAYLNISQRTLLNIFQSLLGISTTEYIHNLKMDTAQYLLCSGNKSIGEISELLGYGDQFTFSKSFRKRFGIPPTQYRKKEKAAP